MDTEAPPILQPGNTPTSFWTATIPQLARWLNSRGYDAEPGRCQTEHSRHWHTGALIVLYHSGTALAQGPAAKYAVTTLATLLRPDQQVRGTAA